MQWLTVQLGPTANDHLPICHREIDESDKIFLQISSKETTSRCTPAARNSQLRLSCFALMPSALMLLGESRKCCHEQWTRTVSEILWLQWPHPLPWVGEGNKATEATEATEAWQGKRLKDNEPRLVHCVQCLKPKSCCELGNRQTADATKNFTALFSNSLPTSIMIIVYFCRLFRS